MIKRTHVKKSNAHTFPAITTCYILEDTTLIRNTSYDSKDRAEIQPKSCCTHCCLASSAASRRDLGRTNLTNHGGNREGIWRMWRL